MFIHVHTCSYMFIHVHTCSYMFIHVHTCSYSLLHLFDILRYHFESIEAPLSSSRKHIFPFRSPTCRSQICALPSGQLSMVCGDRAQADFHQRFSVLFHISSYFHIFPIDARLQFCVHLYYLILYSVSRFFFELWLSPFLWLKLRWEESVAGVVAPLIPHKLCRAAIHEGPSRQESTEMAFF